MKEKPSYDDLERKIYDLESKLENLEENQNNLNSFQPNQKDSLYEHEREFRTLVENAPDIIYRFDKEFRHTYVNAAVEKATGISKKDFIGKNHRDLGMPEDIVLLFQKNIGKVFETGKEREISFSFPTPEGNHYYEARYVPEFSNDETVEHVMGVTRDVTERILAIKALKESEKQLKDLNATKDKFFSIIAHDLKSPFNSMLGFSDILNQNFDEYDSVKQKKFISLINQELQGTYKLLENLLYWSHSQRGTIEFKPEKLNLSALVNEAYQLLILSAQNKSINLINQIPENIHVEADRDMLLTITRNLISNAIKFTNKGGEILLKVKPTNEDNLIEVSVIDNGVGISKEVQSKLFDIGENTSTKGTENEKGTGLGLILCKEFVGKHNGQIWVESEVGKGTTFTFTIPLRPINSEI